VRAEENPYRASRIEALAFRFAAGGLDDLVDRFLRAGRRGAIVGPPGSGKTTLLRAVGRGLRASGIETRWNALPDAEPARAVILVDGRERAPALALTLLRLRTRLLGCGLLATRHAGGGLPTLYRCAPSERIALDLLGELEPSADDGVRGRFLERLHRCHGNVRAALHAMYWERAGSPGRWASR